MSNHEKVLKFVADLYDKKPLFCPECGKEQKRDTTNGNFIHYFKCPYCGFTININ